MRHGGHHSKFTGVGGFTLAELLVVIAIIAVMFAIALPAFVNMAGASKLDAAANAVHSAVKLARQYAITHNQPTYLVFNDDQSTSDANLAYRSYAVFTIDTHTQQPVTQSSGEFLTDWESLPAGIVFDDFAGQAGELNIFHITGDAWDGAFSKHNLLDIQGSIYVVFGFKPTGKAASKTHWIYFAEGFYNNGQVQHTSKQGKQIRFDLTGKSQIMDIVYDENGEAMELRGQ